MPVIQEYEPQIEGVVYPYDWYLLIDERKFFIYPPGEEGNYAHASFHWERFHMWVMEVCSAIGATAIMLGINGLSRIVAQKTRYNVGWDASQITPCLFFTARDFRVGNKREEYKCDKVVENAMVKIIKRWPEYILARGERGNISNRMDDTLVSADDWQKRIQATWIREGG